MLFAVSDNRAMDRLRGIEVFVRVVEDGSVTAAAASLQTAKSSVSDAVRALEERLGVRLRGSRRPADLAHELQGGGADLRGPVLPGASFDEPSEKEANWLLAEGAAVADATPEPAAPTIKVEPLKVQKK
mgnify:CR=1 FL=1